MEQITEKEKMKAMQKEIEIRVEISKYMEMVNDMLY